MNAVLIPQDAYQAQRLEMIDVQLRRRGIRDPRVLAAFTRVPRHEFVPLGFRSQAYEDHPLNIAEGQTISQPYMVASMLEAARIQPADVVLEIGTGSGYETALLAELAAEVFSIERFASLAESAQRLLAHLNYSNIIIEVGDGSSGWPTAAPFDVIVVAAASPRVPQALVEQLRDHGRLLLPVGDPEEQILTLIERHGREVLHRRLFPCKFVPLVGREGFPA